MRLLILLSHERNSRILAEKLTPYYDICTENSALTSGEFDLCIVDSNTLRRFRSELEAHTRAEEPVFLPYLLVVNRDVDQVDTAALELVDEVISMPIVLEELAPRLKSLLRTRHLTWEMSERDQVEEMAATISHDLRNPLNVARGNLELGRETNEDEFFETTADALDRMSTLIDDLLSFAKQEYATPDFAPVSIADIATRSWDLLETGDATFHLELDDDTVIVADPSRLQELFSNLFRNACEHNDGQLTVTVGPLSDGFFVADDGAGIPVADRVSVFETGYSTNTDGTGFGLPIVKRICDAHSWTVSVSDSTTGGAQFDITGVQFIDGVSASPGGE
ncbi:sensor histidine kinase [Haloferax sp. MBLA0076]|uniref:histidine kinase n=3 Tax=Haloferax TaxID=2251 RepID=A0A6A8GL01_9EURY|nr:HAMP domain-containing histidine kinase [Haloferax sp. CBA1148]MRX23746.1 sensor histidine kinase [Haloferax litoreum]